MKRLLCIVGGMNAGGAETFLMKIYRCLDKTLYQMDFCVAVTNKGYYDDEIEAMGGRVLHTVPKSKGPLKAFFAVRKIVQEGSYESVLRVSQNSLSALELVAAKMGGAKVLAFRSSNSGTCGSRTEDIIHKLCKPLAKFVPNVKIAPSTLAAEFMFGKKAVRENKVLLLNNGLNIEDYVFRQDIRQKVRDEFGIDNKLVIGHVGRFNFQKNHHYLLQVFSSFAKVTPCAFLLLVGEGELLETTIEQVKKLGIADKVKFLGIRKDIPQLMMAMDVMILPSLYEGMPNVIIEAQATGLPCVVSNTITRQANILGIVDFVPITLPPEGWTEPLKSASSRHIKRETATETFKEKDYTIEAVRDIFIKAIFQPSF